MLNVHIPNTYTPERSYIINTLMQDYLGIDVQILFEERRDVLIDDKILMKNSLHVADALFQTPESKWLTQDSLPKQPLKIWDTSVSLKDIPLVSSKLPVIYGEGEWLKSSKSYLSEDKNGLYLGLDVFGSAFFMLTRYEEYVKQDRDQHDRFPATASLAYQEGFLDRPIINEYIEILWWCLKNLWSGLERKKREFRTVVSHDVDVPFALKGLSIPQLIRSCGGDAVKRKDLDLALRRALSWYSVRKGNLKKDLNYTFDQLMDISEKNNLQSAFYFKTACTNLIYDFNYSMEDQAIRELMRNIHSRGHEIGIHPSYKTYQSSYQTKLEFEKLLTICENEGIYQKQWGGRQHYLRWQVPITWRNWADAGLNYDSTLSFADHAGFRCGICYEYPVYDLKQRKQLKLTERPLIVMEDSVLGEQYMGLCGQEALVYMQKLKKRCQQFNGDFTLLWHNSSFDNPEIWKMYENILR